MRREGDLYPHCLLPSRSGRRVQGSALDASVEPYVDGPQLDDTLRTTGGPGTASVQPSLAGQDIDENVIPPEDKPVTRRVAEATLQLRRWIVGELGALTRLILITAPVVALIRPELVDFARNFLQIALTGFLGLGGTVVGFLFARGKDR